MPSMLRRRRIWERLASRAALLVKNRRKTHSRSSLHRELLQNLVVLVRDNSTQHSQRSVERDHQIVANVSARGPTVLDADVDDLVREVSVAVGVPSAWTESSRIDCSR